MADAPAFDARTLADAVRQACAGAARARYEAAIGDGASHEEAWQAVLGAIERLDLEEILASTGSGPALVRSVMTTDVATLRPDDRLSVAEDVMRLGRIRHMPVVDEREELCGIVSQRDLLRSALLGAEEDAEGRLRTAKSLRVSEVMTRVVVTVAPDTSLRDAATTMFERKLGCLAVVEDGHLVGIVTEADFVRLAR